MCYRMFVALPCGYLYEVMVLFLSFIVHTKVLRGVRVSQTQGKV